MKLVKLTSNVWRIDSTFAELGTVKSIRVEGRGAWWHPAPRCGKPKCLACEAGVGKSWWAGDAKVAEAFAGYADAETRADLQAAVSGRRSAIEASKAKDTSFEPPCPPGLAFLPFQKAGIEYAIGRTSALIADSMGLGKSVQAVGFLNTLPANETRRVLVVCPASLRINWKREIERWSIRPVTIGTVEGSAWPEGKPNIVIINYDVLVRHEARLRAETWDVLIADELHYCKNGKAQRSKALYAIPARRKLGLTGTPIVNRPIEFWPIASWLAPAEFPSWKRYVDRYCAPHQVWTPRGQITVYDGAANLEELQARSRASFMVRRVKDEVLTELPAKRRQVIPLPWNGSGPVVKALNAAWEAREAKLAVLRVEALGAADEETYKAAVARLRHEEKIAFEEISEARKNLAIEKAPKAVAHIQGLLEDGGVSKAVAFVHHHAVADILTKGLAEFRPVVLTGETSMRDRQAAVDAFQTDPEVRVFIGSIGAAGVGITLTAASTVVFVELDWVPGNVSQAEDRCHRIGQKDTVLVQHLVFDESLDAHLAKVIVAKQEVIDLALDAEIPLPELAPIVAGATEGSEDPRKVKPTARGIVNIDVTDEMREAIHAGLRWLAGMCDGARMKDGAGFNRIDSAFGKALAGLPFLSDRQVLAGKQLVQKYQGQLDLALVRAAGIKPKGE